LVTQPVSSGLDNHYFAIISVNNEKVCISSLLNFAKNIKNSENELDAAELYNGYTIRYLSLQGILPSIFGPIFNRVNKFYYTIIEGHLIVANQASSLRGFINDIRTKNLLVNDDRYHAMAADIPKQSNLLFYCSIPQSEAIFRAVAVPEWVNWLSKYGETLKGWNGLSFAISNQQGVFNSKGCLSYFNSGTKGPQLVWNSKIDTTITRGPFVPGEKNKLILVQDTKEHLYALDFEGNIRWNKKLDSQLKGEIQTVDYYHNGTEQYVLSTSSFIYMFDSLGGNVGNYPIRLPAAASNGIAAINFDTTKKETKLFIACMNLRMYGYELTGKPISGFNTVKLPSIIYQPARLISSPFNKFLALIDQNEVCFFVDRNGERKFTLKEKLNLLEGTELLPAIDSSQLFRWISNAGVVYSSGLSGEVKEELQLNVDSLTGAVQSDVNGDGESDWIITGKSGVQVETADKIVLYRFRTDDYVSNPVLFTNGGKTYFLFSSPASGKFYLLNRDGTLYEGFPQAGMKTPIYVKGDGSNSMSFVVKGDENSINFYQIR
jgi:hypothetical protein